MLYGFLLTLYIINGILLIGIILIQKTKGSMGIGSIGGGSQMLFGGSDGQNIFQKITWILGLIFVFGSLGLSLMKSKESKKLGYSKTESSLLEPASTGSTENSQ